MGQLTSAPTTTDGPVLIRWNGTTYTYSLLDEKISEIRTQPKPSYVQSNDSEFLPYSRTHAIKIVLHDHMPQDGLQEISLLDLNSFETTTVTRMKIRNYYPIDTNFLLVNSQHDEAVSIVHIKSGKRDDLRIEHGHLGAVAVHVNRIVIYNRDFVHVFDTRTLLCIHTIQISRLYNLSPTCANQVGRVNDSWIYMWSYYLCVVINIDTQEIKTIYSYIQDKNVLIQCGMIGRHLVIATSSPTQSRAFQIFDSELSFWHQTILEGYQTSFCEKSFGTEFLFCHARYRLFITDLKTFETLEFIVDWEYMTQVVPISANAYFLNGRNDGSFLGVHSYVYYVKERKLERRSHTYTAFGISVKEFEQELV